MSKLSTEDTVELVLAIIVTGVGLLLVAFQFWKPWVKT